MAGSFEDYGLLPELESAVKALGWHLPTDVQAECIPLILGGGDVMCAAETGSGKTGSFCLPLVQIVHETRRAPERGAAGSEAPSDPSKCAMSTSDRDMNLAVSPDGLVCQARDEKAWLGGRASVGVLRGKYYFEATVTDEGLCRVGWATRTAKYDLGTDASGFGFGGTGKKSYNRKFQDFGEAFGLNDTIGCYVDLDGGSLTFSKNGIVFPKAFDIPKYMRGHIFYPAVVLKNAEMRFNFGAAPFKHPPAEGYVAIAAAPVEHSSCATGGANVVPDASAKNAARTPLALIMEPSLELAQQTHAEIDKFMRHLPEPRLKSALFVGGQPSANQVKQIREGVDLVTASPGRLIDLIQSGSLNVRDVRFFVLDEADRLLDGGNMKIVEQVFAALDKTHLQVLMFSATLHSSSVRSVAEKICKYPTWVDLKGQETVPLTVQHVRIMIDPLTMDGIKGLKWAPPFDIATDGVHTGDVQAKVKNSREWQSERIKLLKARYLVEIINRYKIEQAIIFIRTRVDAGHLETFLNRLSELEGGASKLDRKYSCLQLHAGKGTDARMDNLEAFKNGEVKFLIATDVAARGIDIKELPFVINYTLPDKSEDYVHRVGRVGRAGAPGLAVSLVATAEEKVWFHTCKDSKKCNNRQLTTKRGCCIWYNEPAIVAAVEERLDEPVAIVTSETEFELPALGPRPGELQREAEKQKLAKHSEDIRPMVNELMALENQLQIEYFQMKL